MDYLWNKAVREVIRLLPYVVISIWVNFVEYSQQHRSAKIFSKFPKQNTPGV